MSEDLSFLNKLLSSKMNDSITNYIKELDNTVEGKLVLKSYMLELSGAQYDELPILEYLAKSIKEYVFGVEGAEKLAEEDKEPYREALRYIGSVEPASNGTFGEIILYRLVESILKVPMVSHKVQSLTSGNDQVKGADGVFLGMRNGEPVRLIGEAKIQVSLSKAVDSFIDSLEKFHEKFQMQGFELVVASKNLAQNLSEDEIKKVKDSLDTRTDLYKKTRLIHPVFLGYTEPNIDKLLTSLNVEEIKNKYFVELKTILEKKKNSIQDKINLSDYVKKVEVIVFIIPFMCANKFRFNFYTSLFTIPHHTEQEFLNKKKNKKKKTKKKVAKKIPKRAKS